jgi:hypothetical protein
MRLILSFHLLDLRASVQSCRRRLLFPRQMFVLPILFLVVGPFTPQRKTPLEPFRLKVVRDIGIADTLGYNQCIQGKIYHVLSFDVPVTPPDSDWLADSIELPSKLNASYFSSIPAGTYTGTVVTAPTEEGVKLGWRIILKGTEPRTGIEIHPGPKTGFTNSKNTEGCILVGKRSSQDACWLEKSTLYRDMIKEAYGDPTNQRPIEVEIVNHSR